MKHLHILKQEYRSDDSDNQKDSYLIELKTFLNNHPRGNMYDIFGTKYYKVNIKFIHCFYINGDVYKIQFDCSVKDIGNGSNLVREVDPSVIKSFFRSQKLNRIKEKIC